jgi:uncharacterized protein YkwD
MSPATLIRRCAVLTIFITIAALAAVTTGAGATPSAGTNQRASEAAADPGAEEHLLVFINSARGAVGAPAVTRDGDLDAYARRHAVAVAQAGTLFHSDISALLGVYTAVAENVGYGPDPASVHAQFVASPFHYQNLTDPGYRRVGIGVVHIGGATFAVYVFAA